MTELEMAECLESMSIIVDTREQPSFRARNRYKSFGVPYDRRKIEYGDYTFNCTLPDGSKLFALDESSVISPKVCIERKAGLVELSGNLTERRQQKHKEMQVRNRFEAELKRATENGASVYLLIENAELGDIIHGNYETRLNCEAYFHTITAYMARYGLKIIFCSSNDSGVVIKEILYRELKERLKRGEYG